MYPEKFSIEGIGYRTSRLNEAVEPIYTNWERVLAKMNKDKSAKKPICPCWLVHKDSNLK